MTVSKIEWTDRSDWNPVRGCTRVSPGCGGPGDAGGCYAEAMAARFSLSAAEVAARWHADPKNAGKTPPAFADQWGHGFAEMRGGKPRWTGKVELIEERLLDPLRWEGPAKVFPNSTSDFFHEALAVADIDRLVAVMALASSLTFQVPTKRARRMRDYFEDPEWPARVAAAIDAFGLPGRFNGNIYAAKEVLKTGYLPNVWLGVSVENQAAANERLPQLLQIAAVPVRFISAEPLLGPLELVNLGDVTFSLNVFTGWARHMLGMRQRTLGTLNWIIAGGESGPNARPMHPDWVRGLRDVAADYKVPFFFKQWGSCLPVSWDGDDGNGGIAYIVEEEHCNIDYDDLGRAAVVRAHGREFARFRHKNTGRRLDDQYHNAFPVVAP